MKIPHLSVTSVKEYFELPKSEREWYGLYRLPYGLPLERFEIDPDIQGWDSFYSEIKKIYPIQYFFRKWLPSYDNPITLYWARLVKWPFDNFKYKLKLLINPRFPRWRKSLPRYMSLDITELVVTSNFALICDFYREEVLDGWVDWSQGEHKTFHDQLVSNVKWIEEEREALKSSIDEAMINASNNKIIFDKKLDYHATYAETHRLEADLKSKDTEVLKWFIDNRDWFWT
jgi:hypothetical protein